ncbi:MAG: hypothetical protein A2854_03265 [Parcubacteria group bacterium RIFCSPHIGHO2_01_FULL_56_18]|nr:MAG: hypothetical protein A2854_03265 [Parcubacteria group bacterium RIFCSPHIGHO2_01_FULL_56_18]
MEKKLRDEAKKTAKELGIPLTTIMNAMVRQFVLDRSITLSAHTPNSVTRRAMSDLRARKDVEIFDSFEDWQKAMGA